MSKMEETLLSVMEEMYKRRHNALCMMLSGSLPSVGRNTAASIIEERNLLQGFILEIEKFRARSFANVSEKIDEIKKLRNHSEFIMDNFGKFDIEDFRDVADRLIARLHENDDT